jgi:hypothetical protein
MRGTLATVQNLPGLDTGKTTPHQWCKNVMRTLALGRGC